MTQSKRTPTGQKGPAQSTAVPIFDRLLQHATVVITDGDSCRMKDAQHRKETAPTNTEITARGGDF